MKILKPSPTNNGWSSVVVCRGCSAELEITAADLFRYWRSNGLTYECPCCRHVNAVHDTPPVVVSFPSHGDWVRRAGAESHGVAPSK